MKKKVILTGVFGLLLLGVSAQIIERNLDKEGIKSFVTTHFHEEKEQNETFDFTEDNEDTFLKKLGF